MLVCYLQESSTSAFSSFLNNSATEETPTPSHRPRVEPFPLLPQHYPPMSIEGRGSEARTANPLGAVPEHEPCTRAFIARKDLALFPFSFHHLQESSEATSGILHPA